MDTLPLPPKPNLNYYKKRAKALVAAARSDQDTAVERWARDWIESLVANLAVPTTAFVHASINRAVTHIDERVRKTRSAFTLADAQLLIADAHGFQNWAAFSQHLDRLSGMEIDGDPFELAADAIVTGDLDMLDQLLRRHPGLIRAHSHRVHRATLLHYVAANGVEDFRQKTPANALAIARRLLEAGAAVDARANTYSGGPSETTMNLLVSSTHPAGAGVQAALVDVLLDFGAAVNGVADDASPMLTALDFGYLDAAETAGSSRSTHRQCGGRGRAWPSRPRPAVRHRQGHARARCAADSAGVGETHLRPPACGHAHRLCPGVELQVRPLGYCHVAARDGRKRRGSGRVQDDAAPLGRAKRHDGRHA